MIAPPGSRGTATCLPRTSNKRGRPRPCTGPEGCPGPRGGSGRCGRFRQLQAASGSIRSSLELAVRYDHLRAPGQAGSHCYSEGSFLMGIPATGGVPSVQVRPVRLPFRRRPSGRGCQPVWITEFETRRLALLRGPLQPDAPPGEGNTEEPEAAAPRDDPAARFDSRYCTSRLTRPHHLLKDESSVSSDRRSQQEALGLG